MYSLFELRKVLSVVKPGSDENVNIILTAYSETKERSILALVCDNGYLIFRYINANLPTPTVKQLCWFNSPGKQIKSLSFDSGGFWLLVVTVDASVYILPVLPLLEVDIKVPSCWKSDNLTEIKLAGRRALTSVQWWQTHQGQHIAVIGSELGEISFVNLLNKKEVGGTYITSSISALDILYDESHDTTYLLITGDNQQQWRLLLEEKKSNFYWPFSSESEIIAENSASSTSPDEKPQDEKHADQRPHRLSKFESGTFLTPQRGNGRNLVSAYSSASCLLQVLEGDLDQMHLFSYKVPSDCENIILSDKLIFATLKNNSSSDQQYILKIISRKFSEMSAENSRKKEIQNAEVQRFSFTGPILAMYKLDIQCSLETKELHDSICDISSLNAFTSENSENMRENKIQQSRICLQGNQHSKPLNFDVVDARKSLEGCILVQKDCVWECRLRVAPEELFLSLTAFPTDLPLAEKLGVMLGLDLNKLYEVAADIQLSLGKFAQAVHLYQLSKCPQLKRVAHFMGYGYLSELIAYIQVLFSTKGVEIVSADKCHFANIALHCFAHQIKGKVQERHAITIAFKKFLKENFYYDEEVAAKLLAEQGLYELIHYFSKVRGQQGLMLETLLSTGSIKNTIDEITHDVLVSSGYSDMLCHSNNDEYMKCITSFHLLQFLAAKPSLLNQHLQHIISLMPRMDISLLRRVAFLYDPSRKSSKLYFRNIGSSTLKDHRYWSLTSVATTSDIMDLNNKEAQLTTQEDIIKFFIFVLLMLCHKLGSAKFKKELMQHDIITITKKESTDSCISEYSTISQERQMILSCGQAHVAYICNGVLFMWGKSGSGRLGTDEQGIDYQVPLAVSTLIRLQVNVLAVSCGALHTLALTDCGVFGWGSSRFGQLGAGDVQQASQPIIIESLLHECIIDICCGQYHSLALNTKGRVYTWGWGIHGQLGHGNAEDINAPKLVTALKTVHVTSFSAGQGHSVVLSKKGVVYAFGCGMFGQLGNGSVVKQSLPIQVQIPESIKIIASGYFHVLAVSQTNKVYCWGCNPQALRLQAQTSRRARQQSSNPLIQNLRSSPSHNSNVALNSNALKSTDSNGVQQTHLLPSVINTTSITDSIAEVACGAHHSVLVTVKGEVYSWGRNSEGQIGNGTRKEQKMPTLIVHLKGRNIVHLSCGADFTVAVDTDRNVLGWGQNDGGQIGHRPTNETTKTTAGSPSGRVITIRTNRRMITITQPCRQSILRPTQIMIPQRDVKIGDLDSGSFEKDYSVISQKYGRTYDFPVLSNLDNPSFGPYALHASLSVFHRFCDTSALLNHCLGFMNFQAAAKLCALENLYDQAVEFQLKATLGIFNSIEDHMSTALDIISFYISMLDPEKIDASQKYLLYVIKFWMENSLPVFELERFFCHYENILSYPLSLLLFNDGLFKDSEPLLNNFLSLLSTNFCLKIVYSVTERMKQDVHNTHYIEEMTKVSDTSDVMHQIHSNDCLIAWDDSIPTERLWNDILHSTQKGMVSHSVIHLTASDVDVLAKSLFNDKVYQQTFNTHGTGKRTINSNDIIVFSCGHYFTLQIFLASVLPSFKESMKLLHYTVPKTTKLLLAEYQATAMSAACPKCAITEIKSEI